MRLMDLVAGQKTLCITQTKYINEEKSLQPTSVFLYQVTSYLEMFK